MKNIKTNIFTTGIVIVLLGLSACTTQPKIVLADKDLAEAIMNYKEYVDTEGYKAFAIAMDEDTSYALGESYNQEDEKIASKKALNECKKNKKKYDTENICVLYMIENRIMNDIPRLYRPE
jgi:hypothetical protein